MKILNRYSSIHPSKEICVRYSFCLYGLFFHHLKYACRNETKYSIKLTKSLRSHTKKSWEEALHYTTHTKKPTKYIQNPKMIPITNSANKSDTLAYSFKYTHGVR